MTVASSNFLMSANIASSTWSKTVEKFGRNDAVGTSYEDVWIAGGSYNWLQAASALRVAAGGNAADTAAGAGARTITINGLDENWNEASETVSLLGALISLSTTTTFIRVNEVSVATSGAYGAANTGDINIQTTAGTAVSRISAGLGRTQLSMYSVPDGYTAYIMRISAKVESSKTANFRFWCRPSADAVAAPFGAPFIIRAFDAVSSSVNVDLASWVPVGERADIWVSAQSNTGTLACSAFYDLLLVKN